MKENKELHLKVNFDAKVIEMSKKFAVKASVVGSKEYEEYVATTRNLPTFKVITKATPKRSKKKLANLKGFTIKTMREYVEASKNADIKAEFEKFFADKYDENGNVRYNDKGEKIVAYAENESYGSLKAWFIKQFANELEKDFHRRVIDKTNVMEFAKERA